MNAARWSKLEQIARDTRDKQRESLMELQRKQTEQYARIEQLSELQKDYSARLTQLGQSSHSPQQARQVRDFIDRIHELKCNSEKHLNTLNKAVNAAQSALLSKEHDRVKFEVLNRKLQEQVHRQEQILEQKASEASGVNQYLRRKVANGTSLAS
ncbi:MAG: flagellar FliJ family protein [Halieaceae bacterium]|nr:flagellar FliJ family protein [Halieaceae bacterium]